MHPDLKGWPIFKLLPIEFDLICQTFIILFTCKIIVIIQQTMKKVFLEYVLYL